MFSIENIKSKIFEEIEKDETLKNKLKYAMDGDLTVNTLLLLDEITELKKEVEILKKIIKKNGFRNE